MKTYPPKTYYEISEIFYGIQGEGYWVGTPMAFVRFSGCNLDCHFCDTDHKTSHDMTAQEILREVDASVSAFPLLPNLTLKVPICFTGGEPTLQLDKKIVELFREEGHPLHLETNGTIPVVYPFFFRCITISPKKRLGESVITLGPVLKNADRNCELKIIWDESDKDALLDIVEDWGALHFKRKYIQPLTSPDGSTNVKAVLNYIMENPQWSLSVQLHKILGLK